MLKVVIQFVIQLIMLGMASESSFANCADSHMSSSGKSIGGFAFFMEIVKVVVNRLTTWRWCNIGWQNKIAVARIQRKYRELEMAILAERSPVSQLSEYPSELLAQVAFSPPRIPG